MHAGDCTCFRDDDGKDIRGKNIQPDSDKQNETTQHRLQRQQQQQQQLELQQLTPPSRRSLSPGLPMSWGSRFGGDGHCVGSSIGNSGSSSCSSRSSLQPPTTARDFPYDYLADDV